VEPDATPNVMTWPELYEKMDALVVKGKEMLKAAKARAFCNMASLNIA
jgi:hypothetical protein